MGIFIFLTVVVFELVFAFFCIITKSNQQIKRNIIRIAAFVGFVLFTLVTIIQWSLRYYTLAALLFLLAVIGAVSLIGKRKEKKLYSAGHVVLKAIGMTVLIFMFTLPSIIFPQYKAIKPTGKYQVATINYSYTDELRIETYRDTGEARVLNVEMWFPKNADATFPLIVFSHGAFGMKSSNISLYNELASHGYVVCSIDHTYQCLYTKGQDGHTILMDMGYMNEVSAEDSLSDKQQSYEYYQKWMKIRTGDINFVIDHIIIEAKYNDADTVYKLVDKGKIGVMGHSLGGSAALGIGRMRDDVSAIIALESPFMCDIEGVKDGEFVFKDKIYSVPVLNVYSDDGWSLLANRPQYAENYALLSGANATVFNVHISGVGHFNLTDLPLSSPFLARMFNAHKSTIDAEYCIKKINKICLEFFDSYLKREGKFTSGETY